MQTFFSHIARKTATNVGSPYAFIVALLLVVLWAVTGPFFHYSDTWQLVINTSTTVITFLIVFLIQHTQNVDTKAVHLKLDALITGNTDISNAFRNIEQLSAPELQELTKEIQESEDTIIEPK